MFLKRFKKFLHNCSWNQLFLFHASRFGSILLHVFLFSFSFSFFLLSFFFFLFLSYWTNRILKYLTRNLIFHMPLCQAPKRKRRVSFPCRKQVFFRTNELQRSQQSLVSGVAFPKQVSRPPSCSLTGLWLIWPRLPWVPSVRTQAGKTGRDIKESVFGKGRLGWGVEETCGLTLAALIAAHSRWINPWICFKLPLSSPPPPPLLDRVRHTSMPKTDNTLWHCALMAEFTDIFIRAVPKCRRREATKTIFLPEVL